MRHLYFLRLIVQQEKRNIPREILRSEKEKIKNSNRLIFQDRLVSQIMA